MNTTMKEVIALGAMAGITVTQPTKWRVWFSIQEEVWLQEAGRSLQLAGRDIIVVLAIRQKKTKRKRRWIVEGAQWSKAYQDLPNTSNVAIAAAHALQLVIAYLDAS